MKTIGYLFALAIPLVSAGCGDDEKPGQQVVVMDDGIIWSEMPPCFVQEYVEVKSLSAKPQSGYVALNCLGGRVEAHLVMSEFDCTYNGKYISPSTNWAVLDDFQKITLVSDSDFDEQHKAGTSLADVVNFAGASPYDYIARGYKEGYDWESSDIAFYLDEAKSYEYGYAPVYGLLSEMTAEDFRLLEPRFYLEFVLQPTLGKTHNLTLTVTDTSGEKFTVTWQQQFGE